MPELPDLEYIVSVLGRVLPGRRIEQVRAKNPIVLRRGLPGTLQAATTLSIARPASPSAPGPASAAAGSRTGPA
jgi:formamidopyrimidine-DNA glycosylase